MACRHHGASIHLRQMGVGCSPTAMAKRAAADSYRTHPPGPPKVESTVTVALPPVEPLRKRLPGNSDPLEAQRNLGRNLGTNSGAPIEGRALAYRQLQSDWRM
jgi:hypothetical protein